MTFSTFSFPTTTIFGTGSDQRAPATAEEPWFETALAGDGTPGLLHTEAFSIVQNVLGKSGQNSEWFIFSQSASEPDRAGCDQGADAYREFGCDSIIAFRRRQRAGCGQTRAITAEAAKVQLAEFDWKDDCTVLPPASRFRQPQAPAAKWVAVRSSSWRDTKKSVLFIPAYSPIFVAARSGADARIAPKLTAATGADAMTHAIEIVHVPVFHPLCDGIALEAVHIAVEALPRAYRDGDDLDARGRCWWQPRWARSPSRRTSGRRTRSHTRCPPFAECTRAWRHALCLPAVLRFNAARKPGLYRRIGIAAGPGRHARERSGGG